MTQLPPTQLAAAQRPSAELAAEGLPSTLPVPQRRPGFTAGVRAFFGGFGLIFGDPGLVPLALVPIAVALGTTGLLGWSAVAFVPDLVRSLLGEHAGGVLSTILEIVATVAAVIVAVLLGFALAQPLSGPVLERIVRRVEAKLGGPPWPPTSVISDVLRSLQSMLIPYAFGLPLLAFLFLVNLFFAPAVVVTFPMKLAVTALMLAWDLCDYPLSIRGVRIGARISFIARNATAMLGFGVGLALLGLIPCLLVLVLPIGVAGGARLVLEIERWEAAQRGSDCGPLAART